MTQTLFKPPTSAPKTQKNGLFQGIWIRWAALTRTERFVCSNIVLVPVWWAIGFTYYMPLLLLLSVLIDDWRKYGKLKLKNPSLGVIALLAFGSYQLVRLWAIASELPAEDIPSNIYQIISFWIWPACWFWYIQSNKIKVRLEVIAWGFSVLAIQCFGLWFLFQFVLPTSLFFPPRLYNLFAMLTHRVGAAYVLSPYEVSEYYIPSAGIGGLFRFQFFTKHPLHFTIVAGVMGLLALDIKNRLWSTLLFLICFFLIFVSGSRTGWLIFPLMAILHLFLSNTNNRKFNQILFALIAIASFTILCFPPVTQLISDQYTQSFEVLNKIRDESSNTRFELYTRAWEGFQENPVWGHLLIPGKVATVEGGYIVGSESFILGHLLYVNGLVGTAMFTTFWVSLLKWLYTTRDQRPISCFSVLIFYTILSITLEAVYRSEFSPMLLILCAITYHTQSKNSIKSKLSCVNL